MAQDVIYCLCGQSSDLSRFMIQCDICKDWFHGRCVGVREYQAVDIDRFHCPRCEPYHGPSVLKARLNWHRHDYSEADAGNKAVQTGTQVFIKELRGRHFHSGDKVITRLEGSELTLSYIAGEDGAGREKAGQEGSGDSNSVLGNFTQPILVSDKTGLDLVIPHPSFSVVDVENYVGCDHEVDVIDVQRQTDVKMRLHEFIEYFLSPARTTVLNLISLEFSSTGLSQLVEPPAIVRKLCWVNTAWPSDPPPPPPLTRPSVSKYCLIGVENSYTDFHIDFGGTSVWYHVLWGEKVFYLIRPTEANLVLYQRWMKASNHSEMFFGDQVDACYKCEVKAGETLFIPTGWIHAVLTPTDTLVFGGNFLHNYSVELQLKIYEMENMMCTPAKFQLPHYKELCWFAARHLLQELRSSVCPPASLLQGARALYNALRQWAHQGSRPGSSSRVPDTLQATKLLKELHKELRSTERQAVALHPPRPERESKRRKKKQLADDFVDYTNLTSFHCAVEERVSQREGEDGYDSDPLEEKTPADVHPQQVALDLKYGDQLQQVVTKVPVVRSTPPGGGAGGGYAFSVLSTSSGYSMAGTPPHDAEYPVYQAEYPAALKRDSSGSAGAGGALGGEVYPQQQYDLHRRPGPLPALHPLGGVDPSGGEDDPEEGGGGLMIDESPVGRRRVSRGRLQQELKLKLALSGGRGDADLVYAAGAVEVAGEVEVPPAHHNGIEELLRASAYAPAECGGAVGGQVVVQANNNNNNTVLLLNNNNNHHHHHPAGGGVGVHYPEGGGAVQYLPQQPAYRAMEDLDGSGRASPSTRDAIAGMLSMSRDANYTPVLGGGVHHLAQGRRQLAPPAGGAVGQGAGGAPQPHGPRHRVATVMGSKATSAPRRYLDDDSIKKVHQDDDYVYPTLDHSDEEDFPVFKPRGKKKEDEAWNPKARVRVWGPRPERPTRVGVRRQAVERGLEVAASRRNSQPAAKRAYHRKKGRGGLGGPLGGHGLLSPPSGGCGPSPHAGGSVHASPGGAHSHPAPHRPKKGMATAKQRLGKILKIHKMIY